MQAGLVLGRKVSVARQITGMPVSLCFAVCTLSPHPLKDVIAFVEAMDGHPARITLVQQFPTRYFQLVTHIIKYACQKASATHHMRKATSCTQRPAYTPVLWLSSTKSARLYRYSARAARPTSSTARPVICEVLPVLAKHAWEASGSRVAADAWLPVPTAWELWPTATEVDGAAEFKSGRQARCQP